MLARDITFTDYDGNVRTETHYFNLNKAEIIGWLTTEGDYSLEAVIKKLQQERNGKAIMKIVTDLIYLAYGKKSLDGRRLDKTEEAKRDFMETEAYSELFTELATDGNKLAEFFNAVIPSNLADEVTKIMAGQRTEEGPKVTVTSVN